MIIKLYTNRKKIYNFKKIMMGFKKNLLILLKDCYDFIWKKNKNWIIFNKIIFKIYY